MSMIHIRRYLPVDLDQVVEIWHACKRQAFPYVSVQQAYTIDDDRTHFRDVISQESQVLLAEKDGKILGLMAIHDDLIDQLFIKVDEQRKGIGSQLVEKAKELSPDGLRAYTFQKNIAARSFFGRQGFKVVRSGVSPPPENEPDLEYMWKP